MTGASARDVGSPRSLTRPRPSFADASRRWSTRATLAKVFPSRKSTATSTASRDELARRVVVGGAEDEALEHLDALVGRRRRSVHVRAERVRQQHGRARLGAELGHVDGRTRVALRRKEERRRAEPRARAKRAELRPVAREARLHVELAVVDGAPEQLARRWPNVGPDAAELVVGGAGQLLRQLVGGLEQLAGDGDEGPRQGVGVDRVGARALLLALEARLGRTSASRASTAGRPCAPTSSRARAHGGLHQREERVQRDDVGHVLGAELGVGVAHLAVVRGGVHDDHRAASELVLRFVAQRVEARARAAPRGRSPCPRAAAASRRGPRRW